MVPRVLDIHLFLCSYLCKTCTYEMGAWLKLGDDVFKSIRLLEMVFVTVFSGLDAVRLLLINLL